MGPLAIAELAANGGHLVASGVNSLFPGIRESTEGHGKNVVSEVIHGVMKGLDTVTSGVAGVRDFVGGGIHDAVSSIPLVGPMLGGAVDAVGFAVDAVGGEANSIVQGIGQGIGDVSNIAGAMINGSGYVDFDDITALEELSEAEMAGMSENEKVSRRGITGYAIDKVLGGVFGDGEQSVDGIVVSPTDEGDYPSWYVSAAESVELGQMTPENFNGLYAGYLAGAYTDQDLTNYMSSSVASGEYPDWNSIGADSAARIESLGYSVDDYIKACETELATMDNTQMDSNAAIMSGAEAVVSQPQNAVNDLFNNLSGMGQSQDTQSYDAGLSFA